MLSDAVAYATRSNDFDRYYGVISMVLERAEKMLGTQGQETYQVYDESIAMSVPHQEDPWRIVVETLKQALDVMSEIDTVVVKTLAAVD